MDKVVNVPLIRQVLKNNPSLPFYNDIIYSDVVFLPHLLVELGLFDSTSEVKRNRPDLWREKHPIDFIEVNRIRLIIKPLD